jgi:Outer membrane protein and related peptidoglycan-associated (lipo)proteins
MLIVAFTCSMNADAQGWLKKLGKVAEDAAKRTVESNVDRKTSQAVDDAMNPDTDRKSSKKSSSSDGDASYDEEEVEPQEENATYEQTDFVPGAVAFFEDNLQNEQMGEFPSKWDLIEGSTDVAIMKGKKCIHFEPGTRIEPLMTNQQSYIPDVFTLEFDFWMNDPKTEMSNCYELEFLDADGHDVYEIRIGESYSKLEVTCRFISTTGDWRDSGGGKTWEMKKNDWSHFAMSFNKRALKIYINNKRVINIPNCKSAVRMKIHQAEWGGFHGNKNYMTNFRYAKGAMELYEQKVTDMSAVEKAIAETGKFVTNNILFETGKATLKPESMEEIQKVADYMKKNPSARFEVQGHTDNQGSDAVNDPLSQQRAQAVVDALEKLGCDPFNMRAVGKGSHEPVADNATEDGRAKNRRVEFIKK